MGNRKQKTKKVQIQNVQDGHDEYPDLGKIEKHPTVIHELIMKAQSEETYHKKYLKELEKLYEKMQHKEFMRILFQIILTAFKYPEDDTCIKIGLSFICKFIANFNTVNENENPCKATFEFILKNEGATPHMKFRFCEFINTMLSSLGTEADLDDDIWQSILKYMMCHLNNVSQSVRAQAIIALTRLQDPDDPQDKVTKCFIFHLQNDPSPKVRAAVVSNIALNTRTIPYILERISDFEEKVRAHTYKCLMTQCQIKTLRIEQRLTILEQGFNDESKSINNIVSNLMVSQWLKSYGDNYLSFITGLKLDDNLKVLQRYNKVARLALLKIFPHEKIENLLKTLSFRMTHNANIENGEELEGEPQEANNVEFEKCVSYDSITLEDSIFWLILVEYLHNNDKLHDLDLVLPELSTYCEYLSKFYTVAKPLYIDDWQKLVYQEVLKNLIDMLIYFDFCDEIGRKNLKDLIEAMLKKTELNEHHLEGIARIMEMLIVDKSERFEFLNSILSELTRTDTFTFISDQKELRDLIENRYDIKVKISQLKVNIMDLREEITNHLDAKDFEQAEKATERLNENKIAYNNLLEPLVKLLPEGCVLSSSFNSSKEEKKLSTSTILKCLQIIYFVTTSKKVSYLTLSISSYYNSFIRPQIESNHFQIRTWALKCSATFGMLCEPVSKDAFLQLKKQFYLNQNPYIWEVSIQAIFELLAKYGLKQFDVDDKQNKTSTRSRQLFRGNDYLSQEDDDDESSLGGSSSDIFSLMADFSKICKEPLVLKAILKGYCCITLVGNYCNPDIVSHLLLKYFDPTTDSWTKQMLGVFFSSLLKRGKQGYLQMALLKTIKEILHADNDSALLEIKIENVIKFVIRTTVPEYSIRGINIHDMIADTFLKQIHENAASGNNEYVRALCSELMLLQISDDPIVRSNLEKIIDNILVNENWLDKKSLGNIKTFKTVLNGTYIRKTLSYLPSRDTLNEPVVDEKGNEDELNSALQSRRDSETLDDNEDEEAVVNAEEAVRVSDTEDEDEEEATEKRSNSSPLEAIQSTEEEYYESSDHDDNYDKLHPSNPISQSIKKAQQRRTRTDRSMRTSTQKKLQLVKEVTDERAFSEEEYRSVKNNENIDERGNAIAEEEIDKEKESQEKKVENKKDDNKNQTSDDDLVSSTTENQTQRPTRKTQTTGKDSRKTENTISRLRNKLQINMTDSQTTKRTRSSQKETPANQRVTRKNNSADLRSATLYDVPRKEATKSKTAIKLPQKQSRNEIVLTEPKRLRNNKFTDNKQLPKRKTRNSLDDNDGDSEDEIPSSNPNELRSSRARKRILIENKLNKTTTPSKSENSLINDSLVSIRSDSNENNKKKLPNRKSKIQNSDAVEIDASPEKTDSKQSSQKNSEKSANKNIQARSRRTDDSDVGIDSSTENANLQKSAASKNQKRISSRTSKIENSDVEIVTPLPKKLNSEKSAANKKNRNRISSRKSRIEDSDLSTENTSSEQSLQNSVAGQNNKTMSSRKSRLDDSGAQNASSSQKTNSDQQSQKGAVSKNTVKRMSSRKSRNENSDVETSPNRRTSARLSRSAHRKDSSSESSPRKSERRVQIPTDPDFIYSSLQKRKALDNSFEKSITPSKIQPKIKVKQITPARVQKFLAEAAVDRISRSKSSENNRKRSLRNTPQRGKE